MNWGSTEVLNTDLLISVHSTIALLCLILGLHFMLSQTRRRWPLRLLGGTYLLYGGQSLLLVLQLSGMPLAGLVQLLRPVGAMLLAPLLWWFFQLLRRPDAQWRRADLWHLLPALLTLALLQSRSALVQWLDLFLLLSYSAYLVTVALLLRSNSQALIPLGDDAPVARRYLLLQSALLALNLAIEAALYLELQQGGTLLQSRLLLPGACLFLLLHLLTLLFALQRSPLLEWLYSQHATMAVTDTALPDAAVTDTDEAAAKTPRGAPDETLLLIYRRWLDLLEQQQLYQLEFGITLAQAARKLQVPARLLSNAINQCYGASFSVLLNDRRIRHAQLLLTQSELSVTDLMYQAGFASKSNFHKEFLRVTGTTPTAYRAAAQLPPSG